MKKKPENKLKKSNKKTEEKNRNDTGKNNKYLYGIFIGRFQPFHLGHLKDVKKALKIVDFLIIVLGSAQEKRTERNPLNTSERKIIIKKALTPEKIPKGKYAICSVNDVGDHYLWVESIIKTAGKINNIKKSNNVKNHLSNYNTLVFCGSESSGHFTAKLLAKKGYKIIKLKLLSGISGTRIRKLIRENGVQKNWQKLVPESISLEIEKYFSKFQAEIKTNENAKQ